MGSGARKVFLASIGLVAGMALLPSPARGQSLWLPRGEGHSVLLEILKPSFELIDEEFLMGAVFLGTRYRLAGSNISLVGEVPFARFDGDYYLFFGDPHREESAFGNPYLGFEAGWSGDRVFGELGIRVPLFQDEKIHAALPGSLSDPTRWDAFIGTHVPIHAAINVREVSMGGLAARLRFGPALLIPAEEGYDTELFGVYAWMIGYEGGTIRAGSALSGRILFTGDVGNLGARSTNQFELHADFGRGKFRPGVELKLPLGSAASSVPVVLGVSLGLVL